MTKLDKSHKEMLAFLKLLCRRSEHLRRHGFNTSGTCEKDYQQALKLIAAAEAARGEK